MPEGLDPELQAVCRLLVEAAHTRKGDAIELLELLRFLEDVHQWLYNDLYMPALPNSRQELFKLLHQMEQQGNWPNLPRTQLRSLVLNLVQSRLVDD